MEGTTAERKQTMEPFDDIQCEESIPEHWESSPEPEPLSEEDLEKQSQEYFQKLEQELALRIEKEMIERARAR